MNKMPISGQSRINDPHSPVVGYALWVLGFTGSHRFYYGRPISGTIYLCTGGLFLIGWIVDLFLIPSMDKEADFKYSEGQVNYNITWLLLTFAGVFGFHRFYMGKIGTGIIYLLTGGLFFIGIIHDYWTLNEQIDEQNKLFK